MHIDDSETDRPPTTPRVQMWKARGNPADARDRPGLLVETARQCLAGAITIHPAGWGGSEAFDSRYPGSWLGVQVCLQRIKYLV